MACDLLLSYPPRGRYSTSRTPRPRFDRNSSRPDPHYGLESYRRYAFSHWSDPTRLGRVGPPQRQYCPPHHSSRMTFDTQTSMNSTDKISPSNLRIESPLLARVRALATRGYDRLRGRSRSERRLQLVETLPLGGKRQLMLIVCDGQHFLVGGGSDTVSSITPISPHAHTAGAALEVSSHTNQPGDTVNHGRRLQ
jgi:hypothetical protein